MMGMNTAPQTNGTSRTAAAKPDAMLQVNFANMVNQALQTSEAEPNAVEKARELIQSGRLTTPENIRSAAESLLDFGI
jgi:hypothetical protein